MSSWNPAGAPSCHHCPTPTALNSAVSLVLVFDCGLAEPAVQNKKVSDIPLLYRSQSQWGALCGCPPGLGPCDAGGLGAALQTPARDSGVEDFTGVPDSKFCPRTLGSLPALAFNMLKITEVIGGFSDSLVHPVGGHLTFREVCV